MIHWFIVLFKHIKCATNRFIKASKNFEEHQKFINFRYESIYLNLSSLTLEINMQINKIKLALGLVAGMAMPLVASAAADQEAAMKDANNWAHPRGQHNNNGYSALSQGTKAT